MRTTHGTALGDHAQDVVAGGQRRIILAALVTPADVMENTPMQDLLWRGFIRRQLRLRQITGDTTGGTVENSVAGEDAGSRAYVPFPDGGSRRAGFFAQADFTYDAAREAYRCPHHHPLKRETAKDGEAVMVYRAHPAICNACLVKAGCTASDHGRIVHRTFYAEYLEKIRGSHATAAYRNAMPKRPVWVEPLFGEPLFAEAKEWHGLRRLCLRGRLNANIPGLLIAAGQNLKRLRAATGWGRRHAPAGASEPSRERRGGCQPSPGDH